MRITITPDGSIIIETDPQPETEYRESVTDAYIENAAEQHRFGFTPNVGRTE